MTQDASGAQSMDIFTRISTGLFLASLVAMISVNLLNATIGFCMSAILNTSGLMFGFLAYKRIGKNNFKTARNITRFIICLHVAFVVVAVIYFGLIAYYWQAIMTMH